LQGRTDADQRVRLSLQCGIGSVGYADEVETSAQGLGQTVSCKKKKGSFFGNHGKFRYGYYFVLYSHCPSFSDAQRPKEEKKCTTVTVCLQLPLPCCKCAILPRGRYLFGWTVWNAQRVDGTGRNRG